MQGPQGTLLKLSAVLLASIEFCECEKKSVTWQRSLKLLVFTRHDFAFSVLTLFKKALLHLKIDFCFRTFCFWIDSFRTFCGSLNSHFAHFCQEVLQYLEYFVLVEPPILGPLRMFIANVIHKSLWPWKSWPSFLREHAFPYKALNCCCIKS